MKHVRIQLETTQNESESSVATDTSYWEKLWDSYTKDFASVKIHTWLEETEKIEELSKIAANSVEQGLVKEFTVTLNEENRNYLRNHSIDSNGGLKWFKLFCYKEDIQMLEISQYGSEIDLYGVDETEAEEFHTLFPENSKAEYFKEHLM